MLRTASTGFIEPCLQYDVLADGTVVGRIMLFTTTPTGLPRLWTMAPWHRRQPGLRRGGASATLLALAAVLDGVSRKEEAKLGGMDRRTNSLSKEKPRRSGAN
jgi:hypothetical protein